MQANIIVKYLTRVLADFWATIAQMSPYLLFGFFVAGILSVLVSQRLVEKHLGGRGMWPLLKASFFGVPLPLCSCGVIPVSISLHKHGASKASTIAFLLSTPQTGVDSVFVTLSLLGPVFAVFRPVAALLTGVVGGGLVNTVERSPKNHNAAPQKCSDECCEPRDKAHKLVRGLKYGFITLPRDIAKAMLVGLAIAAVMSVAVPDNFFADTPLGRGVPAMLVMMVLGIPVYVCATASVPVAAALILTGFSPGAAVVFLMTGPATNAAALATIWKALGARTAIVYLLAVVVCALAAGLFLDMTFPQLGASVRTHVHQIEPSVFGHVSAVALLAILGFAVIRKRKRND